jgi:hypothetical protein
MKRTTLIIDERQFAELKNVGASGGPNTLFPNVHRASIPCKRPSKVLY